MGPRMKKIPIVNQTIFALVDDEDEAKVLAHRWYLNSFGYAFTRLKTPGNKRKTTVPMHRLIMGAPKGLEVDHKFGHRLDNRKSQLRIVTSHANNLNPQRLNKRNSSGVQGVYWARRARKWRAQIKFNSRLIYLGDFSSKGDAIAARKAGEEKYWHPVLAKCEKDFGYSGAAA